MRRRFSRHMPPYAREPEPIGFVDGAGLAFSVCLMVSVAIGLGVLFVRLPWAIPAIGIFILVLAVMVRRDMLRRLELIEERVGEDIGTFARAFDRRNEPFDPWVVRAVWDSIQPLVSVHDRPIPLRPDDPLNGTLGLDFDEVVPFLYTEVCARTGRQEEIVDAARALAVRTVGDFVGFVTAQPLIGAHPAEVHAPA